MQEDLTWKGFFTGYVYPLVIIELATCTCILASTLIDHSHYSFSEYFRQSGMSAISAYRLTSGVQIFFAILPIVSLAEIRNLRIEWSIKNNPIDITKTVILSLVVLSFMIGASYIIK